MQLYLKKQPSFRPDFCNNIGWSPTIDVSDIKGWLNWRRNDEIVCKALFQLRHNDRLNGLPDHVRKESIAAIKEFLRERGYNPDKPVRIDGHYEKDS